MTSYASCTEGWRDVLKNGTHSMLCQIVVAPQFQNVMSQCCLFPGSHVECYSKMRIAQQKNLFEAIDRGNIIIDFLKAK